MVIWRQPHCPLKAVVRVPWTPTRLIGWREFKDAIREELVRGDLLRMTLGILHAIGGLGRAVFVGQGSPVTVRLTQPATAALLR